MSSIRSLILLLVLACVGHLAVAQTQTSTPQPTPSPTATPAQPGPTQGDGKLPTVRVRTDEVNLIFTVVDNDGRFVKDLKQDQFRILDNFVHDSIISNPDAIGAF